MRGGQNMKFKNLILKLILAGLLTATLVGTVNSAFIYENSKAPNQNITNNGFIAGEGLKPDQFEDDFDKDVTGKRNEEIVKTIFGGKKLADGTQANDGLSNPKSILNNDLGYRFIGLLEYYITSEDITEVNGKNITYRDYFGLPKDVFFIIERKTMVAEGTFKRTQDYVVYTTTKNKPIKGVVKPVFKTVITWTSESTSFPYSEYGTYRINVSQLGHAPQIDRFSRYIRKGAQTTNRSVSLFNHYEWHLG